MAVQLLAATATTTLLVIISIFIVRRLRTLNKPDSLDLTSSPPEPTMLSKSLASALPNSVVFSHDTAAFEQSVNSYWAQQECEVIQNASSGPATFKRFARPSPSSSANTTNEENKLARKKPKDYSRSAAVATLQSPVLRASREV